MLNGSTLLRHFLNKNWIYDYGLTVSIPSEFDLKILWMCTFELAHPNCFELVIPLIQPFQSKCVFLTLCQ